MRNANHSVRLILFLISFFYSSFAFSSSPREDLPGAPHTMTMKPTSKVISGGRVGHDFGVVEGGISGGDFSTHVTQLINTSKFKEEYEQLKSSPPPFSVFEFEHLLKVYEMNSDLSSLYMMNFESIGKENPISLEYFADLKAEFIRGDHLLTTMGKQSTDLKTQILRAVLTCCLPCVVPCLPDPFLALKRKAYRECIETYERIRDLYRDGTPHIRQLDIKIARVKEYLSFVPADCFSKNPFPVTDSRTVNPLL